MPKTALFDCVINEKCCSVDGGWGIILSSFFVPTPGDLTAQESCPGFAGEEGGFGGVGVGCSGSLELTDA